MIWALLACVSTPEPVVLTVSLEHTQVDSGQPLVVHACVRVEQPGWSWEPRFAEVDGLSLGEPTVQVSGQVSCMDVPYLGPDGSYILPPVTLSAVRGQAALELIGPRLFGDVGVAGPSSELGELQAPLEPRGMPWGWIVLAAGALAGGALLRARSPRPEQEAPALSPPERAIGEWQAVLGAAELTDHQRALALSRITRSYLVAVGAPQAPNLTTSELMATLQGHAVLEQWRGVLSDLLGGADEIKFAGGAGSQQMLERWTEGLHALIEGSWRLRRVGAGSDSDSAPAPKFTSTPNDK